MEYTTTARSNYTNGVDVHQGASWIVRHNLFRNIRAPAGQLAGPAVLMWNGSRDSIIENNLFLNVQYGIALGLNGSKADDHVGGIVRNNFFHRNGSQSGNVGITINNSANTKVLHNTVIVSGTYSNGIDTVFRRPRGGDSLDLIDSEVQQREAHGYRVNNVTNAEPSWFVNAAAATSILRLLPPPPSIKPQPTPVFPQIMTSETWPQGTVPILGLMILPRIAAAEAPTNVRVLP